MLGNASTWLQLEHVAAQRDARFINITLVSASLCNSLIWFVYSCLIYDVPTFLNTSFALVVMTLNLVFWLWASGYVQTATILPLINITKLLFEKKKLPEFEMKESAQAIETIKTKSDEESDFFEIEI
jgi:hypothetical protein